MPIVTQGKAIQGQLSLTMHHTADGLVIHYSDDGAGLRLSKLNEIGASKQLIDSDSNDFEGIKNLIFEPGFSTASSISEISGRGVGMDAVRKFLTDTGSELNVNFSQSVSSLNDPAPIEFSLKLKKKLFVVKQSG